MNNQPEQALGDDVNDLILVIIPNMMWVSLHGMVAYNTVMDIFATTGLQGNQRRDRNSRRIFYFKELADLYALRDQIKSNNLASTAFCVSPDILRHHQINPNAQQVPVGEAWIIRANSSDITFYTLSCEWCDSSHFINTRIAEEYNRSNGNPDFNLKYPDVEAC